MDTNTTDETDLDRLPALLECQEAAHILRITPRAVAYKCARGDLRAVKAGHGWRINRDDLLRYATLR
jgi:excisionase family DNA binding protein